MPGQKIHSSVQSEQNYVPSAVFRRKNWDECMRERTAYRQEHIWEDDIFEKLDAYPLIEALKSLDDASDIVGLFDLPDLDGLAVAVISSTLKGLHCMQ